MSNQKNTNTRPLLGAGQEEDLHLNGKGGRRMISGKNPAAKLDVTFLPEGTYSHGGCSQEHKPSAKGRSKQKSWQRDFTKLEQIEADCQLIRTCLRKMECRLDEVLDAAEKCQRLSEAADITLCLEDKEVQKMEAAKLGFVTNMDVIHRIMAKRPPTFINSEEVLAEWDDTAPLYRDIKAVVDDGSLYVKTPPLLNRNRHWTCEIQTDYFATFSAVVERKVLRILDELPTFVEKNVTIIASYPKDNLLIPDSNNLDTKSVVDAIVGSIPGEDSADCCTFFMASIHNEVLPKGVYFTVSEGFAKVPNIEGNIYKLERLFGGRESNP